MATDNPNDSNTTLPEFPTPGIALVKTVIAATLSDTTVAKLITPGGIELLQEMFSAPDSLDSNSIISAANKTEGANEAP